MTKYTLIIELPRQRAFISSEKIITGFVLVWIWAIGIFTFAY